MSVLADITIPAPLCPVEDDYGWFSAADFDRVLRAIARHTHPERHLLVWWAILFKTPIPTTGYHALAQGADFFGTKAEATQSYDPALFLILASNPAAIADGRRGFGRFA